MLIKGAEVDFIHILHGYFLVHGAILWLPKYKCNNHEKYGETDYIIPLRTHDMTAIKEKDSETHMYIL